MIDVVCTPIWRGRSSLLGFNGLRNPSGVARVIVDVVDKSIWSPSGLPTRRETIALRKALIAETAKAVADLHSDSVILSFPIDFIPQDTKVALQSWKSIAYVEIGKCW
ncbi:hypothetical protein BGW80DRAFT_1315149 [Lactifluus volemus]|nr:hypothetical protein BGW80DRAFT_1315149 [Lactifluus volemus]